jgi:exopolysaccharide biosynthesis polyprenyl glycosylphosphotransferase
MTKRFLSHWGKFNFAHQDNTVNQQILDEKSFAEIIRYERERAERYGVHFSLINIVFSTGYKNHDNRSLQAVYDALKSSIRLIDRIGLINQDVISILLPETKKAGAHIVMQKFKSIFNTQLSTYISSYDMILCTYPEDQDCGAVAYAIESQEPAVRFKPKVIKMDYSQEGGQSDAITVDPDIVFAIENILYKICWKRFLKRVIDIVGSLFGIALFSPIMFFIAIIIKITSKGPVLFRQTRSGYQGKQFTFLKFRSMYFDCKDNIHREFVTKLINGSNDETNMGLEGKPYYKMNNDQRITPFGKFLRKSSLDELPQFFNVLMGQMSLVGPRPPIPYEVENYKTWHKKRILDVKPGITGLWQTKGRSMTTFDEMVRLDLHYAKNWNIWMDIKIMLNTVKAVFSGYGAD